MDIWGKVATLFAQMKTHTSLNSVLPSSMCQTVISVILNPEKSGESHYMTPISLINYKQSNGKSLTRLGTYQSKRVYKKVAHANKYKNMLSSTQYAKKN
jgi:hypothetical protein